MTVSSALAGSSSAIVGNGTDIGQSEAPLASPSVLSSSPPPLPPPPPPPQPTSVGSIISIGASITNAAVAAANRSAAAPAAASGSIKLSNSASANQSHNSSSNKLPELASVRINCKPKALQNSKITSRITILNTTGSQAQQQQQSSGPPKTRVLTTGSNSQFWGRPHISGGSLNHHPPAPHLHHHHHHHLHHHHPHHTTLRHVTSSTPYTLAPSHHASIVSYSISEEDEDEGFNEEAASTTSSSSSSNAELNTATSQVSPSPVASSPEVGCSLEDAESSNGCNSASSRYNTKQQQPNEDEPLPSMSHLTINHQHPSTPGTTNTNATLQLQLNTPPTCCDTAANYHAMLHGSDDEEDLLGGGGGAANGHGPPSSLIIKGPTGSVRGKRNIVRKSINNYTQLVKQANLEKGKQERDFRKEERHKCVLYLTTLGIIRKTFDESKQIKAILKNSFIDYDERDVYINEEFKRELRQRMSRNGDGPTATSEAGFKVPVLFVNGHLLGGFTEIEKLNESGQLLQLLDRYRRANRLSTAESVAVDIDDCSLSSRSSTDSHPSTNSSLRSSSTATTGSTTLHPLYQADCSRCGGTRFVNCDKCFGSRKTYIHHFDYASVSLKCSHCKKTGLVRCPDCWDA